MAARRALAWASSALILLAASSAGDNWPASFFLARSSGLRISGQHFGSRPPDRDWNGEREFLVSMLNGDWQKHALQAARFCVYSPRKLHNVVGCGAASGA